MNYVKIITLFFFLFAFDSYARSFDSDEVFAFGGFINDMVKTAQTSKTGPFCVLGNDEIGKVILDLDKNTVDLEMHPRKYDACRAIYIAQSKEKTLRNEMTKFSKSKILTIAVFEDFTEVGGMVRVDMGRRNFELTVNSKGMKESGIKLNSLAMSLVVN